MTVGEALVALLEAHGVDTVFGIPGVHTIELYRGLAASRIRHVTPRHEQGAGFMADGYARVSGRPGVAFVITGPGLTNILTAMGQARADSIPMLVISGVNPRATLGKGLGYLHELPDQRGLVAKLALFSARVTEPDQLAPALERAFTLFATARPGPVHIEIPLDVMNLPAAQLVPLKGQAAAEQPDPAAIAEANRLIMASRQPLILAGGGALKAADEIRRLAERLDAPVITTINARGTMYRHPLSVPASPSLAAVRELMANADLVIAAGTEFGPTDYDMYANGGFVLPTTLIRIDIDAEQLERHQATLAIRATCEAVVPLLGIGMGTADHGGAARARSAWHAASAEIGPEMRAHVQVMETIRDTLPGAVIVGDSTQPIYAANLCYDHDRPGRWFNAATGFGTLGYGPPAAIGAAIAAPDTPVVSFCGDGGFQFTLPELGSAVDAKAAVIFVVWNNSGYREIESSMVAAGAQPVGVTPSPPDFVRLAKAYGIPAERLQGPAGLADALRRARAQKGPALIEIAVS